MSSKTTVGDAMNDTNDDFELAYSPDFDDCAEAQKVWESYEVLAEKTIQKIRGGDDDE